MTAYKQSRLVMAYNPAWKRQANFETPMALNTLTALLPLQNKRWPGTNLTLEDVRGCSGRHLVDRILQARVMTWNIEFNPTAIDLGGAAALVYGTSGSPTGTPADEAQTITVDATGGTFTVTFAFEGRSDTSAPIAFNATATQMLAALEALRGIKPGNVSVGLVGSVYTITFIGELAKANVPALVTDAASLTGGASTAVVATPTPGVQREHPITRMIADQGPAISFVIGFENKPETYVLYKSVVPNDLGVTAERRQPVRVAVGLRGSANVTLVPDFTMPTCLSQDVIRTSQCRAVVDGVYYRDLQRMAYSSSNNLFDGDDAVPFDDVDVSRLEVGDEWQPSYVIEPFGSNADTLYALGRALAKKGVQLHFGPPGKRVTFDAPSAVLQLATEELGFAGQANRSTIPLTATPLEVSGAAPDRVYAYNSQSTAFLST